MYLEDLKCFKEVADPVLRASLVRGFRRAITETCPHCGAGDGYLCHNNGHILTGFTHIAREKATADARRAREEARIPDLRTLKIEQVHLV